MATSRKYTWTKEIRATTGSLGGVQAINPGGTVSAAPGVTVAIYVDSILVQRSSSSVEGGIAPVGYRIP